MGEDILRYNGDGCRVVPRGWWGTLLRGIPFGVQNGRWWTVACSRVPRLEVG